MSGAESLRHRYGAPPVRPAPYLFLRDRKAERRDGLLVAGRLLCPWPQPLTNQRRDELAKPGWPWSESAVFLGRSAHG